MKKLSREKTKFLLGNGLINDNLRTNWQARNGFLEEHFHDHIKTFLAILSIESAFMAVAIANYVFEEIDGRDNVQGNYGIMISVILIVTNIWLWNSRNDVFTNNLNRLMRVFRQHGGSDIRDLPYYFDKEWKWFEIQGESILSTLGKRLREGENREGSDSPYARRCRRDFKTAHAVFMEFKLCDGDQGKWTKTA